MKVLFALLLLACIFWQTDPIKLLAAWGPDFAWCLPTGIVLVALIPQLRRKGIWNVLGQGCAVGLALVFLVVAFRDMAVHHPHAPRWARAFREGVDYAEEGKLDDAINAFTVAIQLKPDCAEAYQYRGVVHAMKEEHRQAIGDLTKAIQLQPNDKAHVHRGTVYGTIEEFNLAIADFNAAIRLRSDNAKAYFGRGAMFGHLGEYDLAIADFTAAIRLEPNDARAYHNRGIAYEQKGDREKADADFALAEKFGYVPR